jgi:WD40 repeat protein
MKQSARSSSSSSSRSMSNFFWRTLDAPNIHNNAQCQRPIDWVQGARTGILAAALQNDRRTSVYLRLQQGASSRQRNGADCLFSTSIDQTPPIRVLRWGRQDQLTTVHTNGRCIVWDTSKKQSIQRFQLRGVDAQSVVVSHCTPTFTVADRTGCLETIDTRCKRPVRNVQVSENALTKMVASHDEMCYAVSSSRDGTIRVYDIRMMQTKNEQAHGEPSYASPFQTFDHLHNGSVSAMEWSPHAPGQLATGGQRDGVLCITDVYSQKTGDACLTRQPIHDLVWSRSRSSLVLAQTHVVGPSINIVSYAHKRRLPFHRETWLDTRRRQNEPTACYSLAMSPDGTDVAATTNDETLEMLEHMFAPTRRRHSSRWLDDFVPAGPSMCIR